MSIRVCVFLIASGLFFGCSPKKGRGEGAEERLRFDSAVYGYLTNNEPEEVLLAYADFLDVYGERVIGVGRSDSAGFFERLRTYFSEPHLLQLYKDEQVRMADASAFRAEMENGLDRLLLHFPQLRRPAVYLHVSGWGQNVIVTDEAVSLSADKYLGADYPMYQSFFYEYQLQAMTPDRMAPDALLGFLMANFPFRGREDRLVDRMLYEGKLRYFVSMLLPARREWEAVGYSREQYEWCTEHGDRIWKSILERGHLFTPDHRTTSAYLDDAPTTTTLPAAAPGRVGIWLGYRIVSSYMKQRPALDWPALMAIDDGAELLKGARF
jgi:hypothetical protein